MKTTPGRLTFVIFCLFLGLAWYKLTRPQEGEVDYPAAFPFRADARGRMELNRIARHNGRDGYVTLPEEWTR